MTQYARCILTMENVAYSDFMKMMKNENVLRMITRDTIMHTQMAPDPHVILWWACRACFWTICLRASPDNEFKTLPCLAHAKISFWYMTCAYFWFWCFSYKSANSEKDLETCTRTTFPLCTRDDGLPNVAVAHDFWRNSYCRARILLRLPIKHLLNSWNCMTYLEILTCYTILLWNLISRIPTSMAFNNENATFLLRALAGSPKFVRARTGSHGVSRCLTDSAG